MASLVKGCWLILPIILLNGGGFYYWEFRNSFPFWPILGPPWFLPIRLVLNFLIIRQPPLLGFFWGSLFGFYYFLSLIIFFALFLMFWETFLVGEREDFSQLLKRPKRGGLPQKGWIKFFFQ